MQQTEFNNKLRVDRQGAHINPYSNETCTHNIGPGGTKERRILFMEEARGRVGLTRRCDPSMRPADPSRRSEPGRSEPAGRIFHLGRLDPSLQC